MMARRLEPAGVTDMTGTGTVMFEVGLGLGTVLVYFAVGQYYRIRYGVLAGAAGLFIYTVGLWLNLHLLSRVALLLLPFAIMMYRTRVTYETFPESVNVCPVCGWRNEPSRTTCGAPRCDAPLPDMTAGRGLSYYFPRRVVAWIVIVTVFAVIIAETRVAGWFLFSWLLAAWPAFAAIAVMVYLFIRLR